MAAKEQELGIETLTDEGMKMLRLEIGDLYATLGGQLLTRSLPTRAAGIVSYMSAVRSAFEAKTLYEALPSGEALTDWGRGLEVIYEGLQQDGMRFFQEVNEDLRKALCNEDILHLTDVVNRSAMHIVVTVVAAALRLPREFDPIAVTVSTILFKLGLRNFCR